MNKKEVLPHRSDILEELQEVQNELNAFVHRVSHDLKGPLARLEGVTQLINSQNPGPEIQFSLRLIEEITRDMNQVVNDLIYVQGLFQGEALEFEIQAPQLVQEVMAEIQSRRKGGITFQADIQIGDNWVTDRTLVKVILEQLISNAFQFHKKEGPGRYVNLRMRRELTEVILEIKDNGQGIPPKQAERMFDLFYRGSEDSQGSGLGLYLVRKAVAHLKGRIEVETDPGHGSLFRVYLPDTRFST